MEQGKRFRLTRRRLLTVSAAGAGVALLAACGGAESTATTAPASTAASTAPSAAASVAPAATATEIPRSVGGASTPVSSAGASTAAASGAATSSAPASAAAQPTRPANLADRQVFRYSDVEPPSFDPGVGSSPYNMPQIFEGVIGVNWIDNSFDLLMAESYTANADATVWTFKIKPNLKWSDGTPLTAKDFEYSMKRVMDPKTASKYTAAFQMVKNGLDVVAGKMPPDQLGVTAPDDRTLEVTLSTATPFFPLIMATWTGYPVPKHVIDKAGDKWVEAENIVSNGSFILKEWKHDQLQAFEHNPNYWGPKPIITRAECYLRDQSQYLQQGLAAYENNEQDTALIAAADYERVKGNPTLSKELKGYPGSSTQMLHFDCTNKPTDNPKVRQALHLGWDRKALIDVVLKGYYLEAPTVIPADIPGNNPNAALTGGIERAKQLMTEAGYANGAGWPADFTVVYSASATGKTILEFLQQEWKKNLGINVALDAKEQKAYVEWRVSRVDQPFNAHYGVWGSDYGDPSNWHNFLFHTKTDFYKTHWKNDEYNALIDRAAGMPDKAAREKAYQDAEVILMNDMPHMPIYHGQNFFVIKPNLQGQYHPAILGTVPRAKYAYFTK
jgi:oligopeptide transport system substrate-binding protein